MVDLVWCELCEDDYLLGFTGEHMWDVHPDIMKAREAREKRLANPCLYCGEDEDELPFEDTDEHRSTSAHQYAQLNS